MIGIFVDSSAWYALLDRRDPEHARVAAVVQAHRDRLVTSDYILDEAVTLVRYRLGWPLAHRLGAGLRSGELARLARVLPADLDAAWKLFSERRDQRLSVTDCTSFAVMTRLKLDTAIALDQDFKAMG
ncbi:MAG: PIN domain-containing protein, partial [Geminicoccaceae bacterium]